MGHSDWTAADWPSLAAELRRTPTDAAAWQVAFDRLRILARRVLSVWPSREEEPDDLANEVLLKLALPESRAAEVLSALRFPEKAESYLASMMRNAVVSRLRRFQTDQRILDIISHGRFEESHELPAFGADEQEALTRELRRLSPAERELLKWKYWECLSNGQIAERLGISYSNASVRLYRLLRKLRDILKHFDRFAE